MKKLPLLYVFALSILLIQTSCKKDDEPVAPSPVVGTWIADKVALSNFPAPYTNYNRADFDPNFFGIISQFELTSDKKFTYRYSNGVIVDEGTGTWTLTNTTLKLTYDDASQEDEDYEFNETRKELSGESTDVTFTLTNPTTQADEDVSGKSRLIYRKQ